MISQIFTGLFLSVFSFFSMAALGPVFKERSGRDSVQVQNMQLVEDGVLKASHGFLLDEQGDILCQVDIANTSSEDQVSLVPGFVTPVSASSNQAYDANIPVCSSLEKQAMAALASQSRSSLDNQYAGLIVSTGLLIGGYGFCAMYKDAKVTKTEDGQKVVGRVAAAAALAAGAGGWADTLPKGGTVATKSDMLSKAAGKGFLRGLGLFGVGWLICDGVVYLMQE